MPKSHFDELGRRQLLYGLAAAGAVGCWRPHAARPAPPAATARDSWRLAETIPTDTELRSPHPTIASAWHQLLQEAREHIALSHFYVSERAPSALTPILASLRRAPARGIQVRLLVDKKMAALYPQPLDSLRAAGIAVRLLDAATVMGGVQHAKYMLVDDAALCLGSANFDWRSLQHIHELAIVVRSAALTRGLRDVFERDWASAQGAAMPAPVTNWPLPKVVIDDCELKLALSPQGHLPYAQAWDLPQLLSLLANAQKTVLLQLLTLQPHYRDGRPFEVLHQQLRAAANRGVQVHVLLSHWELRASHIDSLKRLTRAGIAIRICTITEHSDGFIPYARVNHAKYLVVDGNSGWMGTSNWDGDYFYHSRNVGLVGRGGGFAAALTDIFSRMWNSRYSANLDPARDYPEPRIGS